MDSWVCVGSTSKNKVGINKTTTSSSSMTRGKTELTFDGLDAFGRYYQNLLIAHNNQKNLKKLNALSSRKNKGQDKELSVSQKQHQKKEVYFFFVTIGISNISTTVDVVQKKKTADQVCGWNKLEKKTADQVCGSSGDRAGVVSDATEATSREPVCEDQRATPFSARPA